jgi:hypothetical protein
VDGQEFLLLVVDRLHAPRNSQARINVRPELAVKACRPANQFARGRFSKEESATREAVFDNNRAEVGRCRFRMASGMQYPGGEAAARGRPVPHEAFNS